MNEIQQLIDLTKKGLTQVATQLGTTLPQLWEIMIMQQYVEAMVGFLQAGIILFIWYLIIKSKAIKKMIEDDFESLLSIPFLIFLVFFVLLTLYSFVIDVPNGIAKLINPEYYAIKDIVYQIGTLTNK